MSKISTPVYLCGYRPEAIKKAHKYLENFFVVDMKSFLNIEGITYFSKDFLDRNFEKYFDENTVFIPTTEKGVLIYSELLSKLGKSEQSAFLKKFFNKEFMKNFCIQNGIKVTPHLNSDQVTPEEAAEKLSFPIYMKKKISSGSREQRIAQSLEDLRLYWSSDFLLEKKIHGIEFSIESIVYKNKIYFTNITTYHRDKICNVLPSFFDETLTQKILDFNKSTIEKFNIKNGFIHLEAYIVESEVLFGEIAFRPPGGYLMKLIEKSYGFDPWEQYFRVLNGYEPIISSAPSGYSSVWIVHPGEGKVQSVDGLETVLKDKNLVKYKFKIEKNKYIKNRDGSGQNYGYFIFYSKNQNDLLQSLESVENNLYIGMRKV